MKTILATDVDTESWTVYYRHEVKEQFLTEWFMFCRALCRECNAKEKAKGMGKYVCHKCQ